MINNKILKIYTQLLECYGPQGWWPLLSNNSKPCFNKGGYHPSVDYIPTSQEVFEIAVGAVLTQNTTWSNVVLAINKLLDKIDSISPENILSLESDDLASLIKSSGYFNQKAKKLRILANYFVNLELGKVPIRDEISNLWGLGPETVDCIMLYGFNRPHFVIDKYTLRMFSRLNILNENTKYDTASKYFSDSLPNDIQLLQEYHALIVEHGKKFCKAKPECLDCTLRSDCQYYKEIDRAGGC